MDPREWDEELKLASEGNWEALGLDPPPEPGEGATASQARGFERVDIEDLVPVHEMKDPGAR